MAFDQQTNEDQHYSQGTFFCTIFLQKKKLKKKLGPNSLHYQPIFDNILTKDVLKRIFDNKFQSIIVTYKCCMIPHSLTFSFILGHFGFKQNPAGLQEAIQRLNKNSEYCEKQCTLLSKLLNSTLRPLSCSTFLLCWAAPRSSPTWE